MVDDHNALTLRGGNCHPFFFYGLPMRYRKRLDVKFTIRNIDTLLRHGVDPLSRRLSDIVTGVALLNDLDPDAMTSDDIRQALLMWRSAIQLDFPTAETSSGGTDNDGEFDIRKAMRSLYVAAGSINLNAGEFTIAELTAALSSHIKREKASSVKSGQSKIPINSGSIAALKVFVPRDRK